jgi:hypothetical protein
MSLAISTEGRSHDAPENPHFVGADLRSRADADRM